MHELGRPFAVDLARRLGAAAADDETRAAALFSEAWAEHVGGRGGRARRRARALLRRLVTTYATTTSASAAHDLAWRLEHLVLGTAPPDFVARDVDGNALRLADLRGQVVLIHFWSPAPAAGPLAALAQGAAPTWERWLALHRDDPGVAFLFVCLDSDERAFRRTRADHGFEWPNALVDPAGDGVPWRVREAPATFVLDAQGALRLIALRNEAAPGRDLFAELDGLLEELVHDSGDAPQAADSDPEAAAGR